MPGDNVPLHDLMPHAHAHTGPGHAGLTHDHQHLHAAERGPGYWDAVSDLTWLWHNNAFTGIAGILRERRRQVDVLKVTPVSDNEGSGWMALEAAALLKQAARPGEDRAARLREAGALIAAEIERLAAGNERGKQDG